MDSIPDLTACSETLYRLSYPVSYSVDTLFFLVGGCFQNNYKFYGTGKYIFYMIYLILCKIITPVNKRCRLLFATSIKYQQLLFSAAGYK